MSEDETIAISLVEIAEIKRQVDVHGTLLRAKALRVLASHKEVSDRLQTALLDLKESEEAAEGFRIELTRRAELVQVYAKEVPQDVFDACTRPYPVDPYGEEGEPEDAT